MGNKQPKLDPKEEAKQNKRTIQRAIRQIDRERTKLQAQETKTLREIKTLAQKNQHVSHQPRLMEVAGSSQNHVERPRAIEAADKHVLHDGQLAQSHRVTACHGSDQCHHA